MAQTDRRQYSDDTQDLAGGLVVFAAVMLVVSGVLDLLRGIMGIAEDDVFLTTPDYTFQWDTTGWGWAHLILGAVSIAVALGLFRGALWARVAGVVMAAVLLVANFLSLPYYPIWSIVLIALCALVIWALSVYRRGPV
ncbi:DUF7144 family membrane protein [Streptomyces barkulensis]|uniref:DUF7144 family membrane protein n=1 Tax=Streptomyces barkulensis TaxID=1257026 RepID=UPI000C6D1956|nr:hypothetical protein [Streptomyces barkulensis]